MEPETVIPTSSDDRVKKLEEALETAAKERQEILEAAEKEIDYHRSIAAELESSMINDFEWKLHEIESEYNRLETSKEFLIKKYGSPRFRNRCRNLHRTS